MKVGEYRFTDYYHQFMTIEADDLTEELKDQIEIHDDDCFALCSSYCARDGLLEFNVLSVGSSWENCTKGLERPEMLGVFSIDQVFDKTARIVEPSYEMIQKNTPWMERRDAGTDDDLLMTRLDPRLDGLRDPYYPDIVLTGIVVDQTVNEYDMRITGIKGPFLTGTIEVEPDEDLGIHLDDPIWALPYLIGNECRLFALFAGSNLSEDQVRARDRIIHEMDKAGISFNGFTIRS